GESAVALEAVGAAARVEVERDLLRAGQRPAVLGPPLVGAEHEDVHRLLVVDPVALALEPAVEEARDVVVELDDRVLAEVDAVAAAVVVDPVRPRPDHELLAVAGIGCRAL